MADHIVTTLQMLSSKYPDCGLILGADKNYMDIGPILRCGLRLRQVVDQSTRQGAILDIIIMNLWSHYKSPVIVPPIQPEDPTKAKPIDHSVPVCVPHIDRHCPPRQNYRTIKYRPLPDSSVSKFGEWLVRENWDNLSEKMTSSEQVSHFEELGNAKLDEFCPLKEIKLSSKDKPFISAELKQIDRKRNREYVKRGKTEKYKNLESLFQAKYKIEAEKHLKKSMDALKETNPGKAYGLLKKMGAQPGEDINTNSFTLPSHENLSAEQSAECIATHFAGISQEFPPLNITSLPVRVKSKLHCKDVLPVISEFEAYKKIKAANKPRSGVPNDLPKQLNQEFAPELATPVSRIVNRIAQTGEWPSQWKLEHVVPVGKIPTPESEDDLRPISLTAFFSKVTEHFVVMWLMDTIKDKIYFRQYSGLKGNSITHFII